MLAIDMIISGGRRSRLGVVADSPPLSAVSVQIFEIILLEQFASKAIAKLGLDY